MEFPQLFLFEASDREEDSAQELAVTVEGLGIEAPFVVSSVHGKKLAAAFKNEVHETPRAGADQQWAGELGSRAHRSGADAIVAIGGGRCLDVAKLAAARAGVTLFSVPTQLSHDGICSPVAVVPGDDGRAESIGAIAPRAVFVSLPTLVDAPSDSVAAGLGDLLANPLALRDWALAAERGLETLDQAAWDLSVQSFQLVEPDLDTDPAASAKDPAFLKRLADALVLSGMAMIRSGTSRPASGGEHEVSHAIDELLGGRALHGAQVAFGCMISLALYEEDTAAFRRRLQRLGLPNHPADLGLTENDLVRVLVEAPDTRPGRFTILEHADLDGAAWRALVRKIWPAES
jgi:glycerol-1-phosphate dehydrogenase [NAD(P)+]